MTMRVISFVMVVLLTSGYAVAAQPGDSKKAWWNVGYGRYSCYANLSNSDFGLSAVYVFEWQARDKDRDIPKGEISFVYQVQIFPPADDAFQLKDVSEVALSVGGRSLDLTLKEDTKTYSFPAYVSAGDLPWKNWQSYSEGDSLIVRIDLSDKRKFEYRAAPDHVERVKRMLYACAVEPAD